MKYAPRIGLGLLLLSLLSAVLLSAQLRPDPLAQPANFLAADKGYGVTIDLTQIPEADLPATLADLRAAGLLWLRQSVRWADLEPQPGQFDWASLDRALTAVRRDNQNHPAAPFKLIAVLSAAPDWARPPGQSTTAPPAHLADFGRFARAFATRYGPDIAVYQIWDEPNLSAAWGNTFVEPEGYAALLREAALNLRAADPAAVIMLAALAPTLERNPLNLTETDFLARLYQAHADEWFDIVAVQAYGFDYDPADPAQAGVLNFQRAALVRQVILANDDGDTPVWATAFGWNTLPAGWVGPKSPWKSAPAETQARRTTEAIALARREWPWLGPMLAIRWDAAGLAPDDPARGFSLVDTSPVRAALQTAAAAPVSAGPGQYPADHPSGQYSPGWRLAQHQADLPATGPATLTLPFTGTRLDLLVNRGNYRGYLWVTVDGQAANALPQDSAGRSYVVLSDPQRQSAAVTLADNLPDGPHLAVIRAEGGWGQWAVGGWTVSRTPDQRLLRLALALAGLITILSGHWLAAGIWRAPGEAGRQLLDAIRRRRAAYAGLGYWPPVAITFGLGIAGYLSPGAPLWVLLGLLALALLLRPDTGVMLVAFGLSFVQQYRPLPIIGLSLLEFLLIFTALGAAFALTPSPSPLGRGESRLPAPSSITTHNTQFIIHHSDWPVLALLLLGLLATFNAANFGVSMLAWRTILLAGTAFYFLIRLRLDFQPTPPGGGWPWPLVDALAAGVALQAGAALALYAAGWQVVEAENVYRVMGAVYASPNHLALFLGRVWPILLAVALLPGQPRWRRAGYGGGLLLALAALYLTYSKGALLLGLPAGLGVMAGLYGRRRGAKFGRGTAAVLALVLGLAAALALSTGRLLTAFDFGAGSTGFFRLAVWQSTLAMLRDYWPLGVGLDNFLYLYRTTYILPQAWQEPELSHPHNFLLDFGVSLGLGGVAVLGWLQLTFWRAAWRRYRADGLSLALGLMGSMAVFLAHGLVDNAFFLIDLGLAFFLALGLAQGLSEAQSPSSDSKA